MTYRGIEILAEATLESSVWTLNDNGELAEHRYYMNIEPEIQFYGIDTEDGYHEWFKTLDELKQFIDDEVVKGKE